MEEMSNSDSASSILVVEGNKTGPSFHTKEGLLTYCNPRTVMCESSDISSYISSSSENLYQAECVISDVMTHLFNRQ